MRNPGDEELRELERLAAAGDFRARQRLVKERRRRGIKDPTWRGALRLKRRADELPLVAQLAYHLANMMESELDWAADNHEEPRALLDVADHLRQNISDDGPAQFFGAYAPGSDRAWADVSMAKIENELLPRAVEMVRDRRDWWQANPGGDEGFRELERAASLGDSMAIVRLGAELNRRGQCAACRAQRPLPGVTVEGLRFCDACSARRELAGLEAATKAYSGYFSGRPHFERYVINSTIAPERQAGVAGTFVRNCTTDPGYCMVLAIPTSTGFRFEHQQQTPQGQPGQEGVTPQGRAYSTITTAHGFPLVAVTMSEVHQQRGRRSDGDYAIITWRGMDRWGREWYGRGAGRGMFTNMHLRKVTPGQTPRNRRRIDIPGEQYAAEFMAPRMIGSELRWLDDVPPVRALRAWQDAWLAEASQ